jgi:eukaryotic-like serine/threonine-protein kinase
MSPSGRWLWFTMGYNRSARMPLTTGTLLGPYEILAVIGSGGMGEVYRARDTRLGREVALKILPADVAGDPSRRQRFELEARAVAALNHPNIVAIYDAGTEAGVSFIVSELVDGEPLRGMKLGLRKTLDIAVQIAGGLAAAHEAGITHRDLKPDNILLARDGRVKILDFGLAKIRSSRAPAAAETVTVHTEAGVVMGTVGYMSPEQVRGLDVDHRSDLFSFGVVLHELLAGKRAFQGETSVDTMQAILRQDPPQLPDNVPVAVRLVVAHCLEKEPANRFQSARDLGFALATILPSGSGAAAAAPTLPVTPRPRRLFALAALVLVVAGVIGAILWLRPSPAPIWTGVVLGGPNLAMFPRLASDGRTLAFLAAVNDIPQVAVMKPESGNWVVLTRSTDTGYIQFLSWSADGTRIFYDRWTDTPRGVYSVPALGGAEQLILEDAGSPEALPDGSLLMARYNSERQYQLLRFWPETGRSRVFPLQLSIAYGSPIRVFPDGREAVVIATRIGPGREGGPQVYVLDLASGSIRCLIKSSPGGRVFRAVAVNRDGKSVLAAMEAGNVIRIEAVGRNGHILQSSLLTLTSAVLSLEPAADGSLYLDQMERPVDVVRFSAQGGHAQRIAAFPDYEAPGSPALDEQIFAVLPDGRAAVTQSTVGRRQLMAVEAGKDPVPFINTTEPTCAPVTAAGPGQIAFLIGPPPQRTIALAATSNGRITRRIPFDKGEISALASSPDGKTLYCAAGGNIWSIAVESTEARKIRAGDHVAVDPSGQFLLVQVTENPIIRLIRVPLDGSPEREIPRTGPLRPANMIGPNAIGRDGRILMPLGSSTLYWPPGLLNASTGQFTRIPVDYLTDYHVLNWTPDGNVMALGLGIRAKMWKFQPNAAGR